MKNLLLWVIILLSLRLQSQEPPQSTNIDRLAKLMTGFFSTESQALTDSNYFHIRLCMQPIWQDRADGYWLYVEQAAYATLDRPYRQRIYHLFQKEDSDTIISKVYEIEGAANLIGGCQKSEVLHNLAFDVLIDRPGCELFLLKKGPKTFSGSTWPGACLSTWRGASWVSSDVTITPSGLLTWDRGWDDEGNLIWGPESGGYRFDRVER